MQYRFLKNNKWCDECKYLKKIKDKLNEFVDFNDGKCCFDNYVDSSSILNWSCNGCNNSWNNSYTLMRRRKYWCQHCKRKNLK